MKQEIMAKLIEDRDPYKNIPPKVLQATINREIKNKMAYRQKKYEDFAEDLLVTKQDKADKARTLIDDMEFDITDIMTFIQKISSSAPALGKLLNIPDLQFVFSNSFKHELEVATEALDSAREAADKLAPEKLQKYSSSAYPGITAFGDGRGLVDQEPLFKGFDRGEY